ncbi:MAG: LysM peptidoglycan-binding domain-containing protein [Syntrophaceae bacterium]|nr:LysM peptidoglycan-binding domain-containing protein [Syntrophaceae bacterium]
MSKTKIIRYALTGLLLLSFMTFVNAQETPETQSPQETREIQDTPETQSTQETQEIQGTSEKQDTKDIKEIQETNRELIKNGIKEYTAVKGDTLWSIAKKELNDPFMWSAIWKENPDIDNPRWIYPGQIIRIPLYLVQEIETKETLPIPVAQTQEPSEEEAIEEIPEIKEYPLVNEHLIIASGYIAEAAPVVGTVCGCPPEQIFSVETPRVGQVEDSPYGHTLFGDKDIIYIKVDRPVKVGDKFYVVKVSDPISHPITGAKIGHVITISGIVEIVEVRSGDTMARITKCFGEISQGDILDSYYDIKIPMTTGSFRSPDINGMILAAAAPSIAQSTLDIVYIDKGCKDGIEIGDMFRTMAVGHHVVPNGMIQVISCKDHTATAIIQRNSSPVVAGNIFTKIENNQKANAAIK